MLPRLYCEKFNQPELRAEEMEAIKTIAVTNPVSMDEIIVEKNIEKYYYNLGPDLNIPCYGINYKNSNGSRNTSLKKYPIINLDITNSTKL